MIADVVLLAVGAPVLVAVVATALAQARAFEHLRREEENGLNQ